MRSIYTLKNTIMTYSWGSSTAIAALLGDPAPSDTPQAELWLGAHPKASSMIEVDEKWVSLIDYINRNPVEMLGETTVNRFGNRLPYLFKVLAAAQPLSIQAHPDKAQAETGFARENSRNIPIDASHRNYRDDNHKPECICALTPFWALNGFRQMPETVSMFRRACPRTLSPEIDRLNKGANGTGLKRIFNMLLTLPKERKVAILNEAFSFAKSHVEEDPIWKWVVKLKYYYPDDIGVLAPIFLNLVCLPPGQAMYLPAGRLHAYLEGTGLELMANSDNVLRGGLTPKHVDVAELHAVLRFEPISIDPILPRRISPCEEIYDTPATEFLLSRITLGLNDVYQGVQAMGARVLLCTQGDVIITDVGTDQKVEMNQGGSVFISGSVDDYTLVGEGELYMAAIPQGSCKNKS
ncbi:MAG: mannose-6-phosphate isomerase, class I [Thermodesulfobacteriota bacterium]|nr:mannose-6-phosphate isomerase, class I [Thermodesulfobacteriota bacterium]